MSPYRIEGLVPKSPRELAIFKDEHLPVNVYDTVYKLSYQLSFAAFAQDHRHRTIRYNIKLQSMPSFYTPKIVRVLGWEEEWQKDIMSVKDIFPQGLLIDVTENGEISDFISKCYERCCGRAQHEIQELTNENLDKFRQLGTPEAKEYLLKYVGSGSAS